MVITFFGVLTGCAPSGTPEEEGNVNVPKDEKHTGYIEVDGSKLDYVVEGDGKPCLVIGSSVYYPKTFSDNLREHLRMYFVDLKWFARDHTA